MGVDVREKEKEREKGLRERGKYFKLWSAQPFPLSPSPLFARFKTVSVFESLVFTLAMFSLFRICNLQLKLS